MLGVLCLFGWWMRVGSAETRMYRWVDDAGTVHYSDQIPPAQAAKGHAKLNQEGLQTEVVEPASTEDGSQEASAAEQAKLQAAQRLEQENLANQQILARFRSMDDIRLARDGKVAAVEALCQVIRDRVRRELRRLRELHQKSAELKRTDKPLDAPIQADIADAVRLIRSGYATILDQEFRKAEIRAEFEEVMARYRTLKKLPEPDPQLTLEPQLGNLVSCTNSIACNQDWEKALSYVRTQTHAQDEILGQGLLIAISRDAREERLLTLVWLQKNAQEPVRLYLDLECKNLLTASLVCTNTEAMAIRDGLRLAVTGTGEARPSGS